MKKNIWQIVNRYKLFIILGVIILGILILKFTSKKEINNTNNESNVVTKTVVDDLKNNIIETNVVISPTQTVSEENKKALTPEEVSNLGYEDYFKYMETLTEEEQKRSPPLAAMVNESLPYERDSFRAEKFENLKVYAKYKIDDKAKAERALKYWYYIEIGSTLPSDKIVWQ